LYTAPESQKRQGWCSLLPNTISFQLPFATVQFQSTVTQSRWQIVPLYTMGP